MQTKLKQAGRNDGLCPHRRDRKRQIVVQPVGAFKGENMQHILQLFISHKQMFAVFYFISLCLLCFIKGNAVV